MKIYKEIEGHLRGNKKRREIMTGRNSKQKSGGGGKLDDKGDRISAEERAGLATKRERAVTR